MKRIALPLIAMAFSTPAIAQDTDPVWQGYYAGIQVDHYAGFELTDGVDSVGLSTTSFTLFGGYRTEVSGFILGAEYDLSSSRTGIDTTPPPGVSSSTRLTHHKLGFEGGYAVGRYLPYVQGGLSHIRFDGDGGTFTNTGTYFGVGLDYQVGVASTVGVELTGYSHGDLSNLPGNIRPELSTIGINYAISF